MKNSSRFFANRECEYYPCHKGIEEMNCLFCYCPFYLRAKCPGNPTFREKNGRRIKDCTNCIFPHKPEHYEVILEWIRRQNAGDIPRAGEKAEDNRSKEKGRP